MDSNIKEKIGKTVIKIFGLKNSLKIYYFLKMKRKLNLKDPKRFSEKIQLRKLNYNNSLYYLCADKYLVRDYVKNKIGEKYLIPLLFVGDNLTKKDISSLPKSFIIKTNNASKTNIIVLDKKNTNFDDIIKKTDCYLESNFWYRSFEMFYSKIKPKVIVEKLIFDNNGNLPDDYKFHVFKDKKDYKIIIQIDSDRITNHKRAFYDENWNRLGYSFGFQNNEENKSKPQNFNKMLEISKKLANDFDYVRVDLYNVNGKIYFGELTFTHGSGYEKFVPDSVDFEWGSYWK